MSRLNQSAMRVDHIKETIQATGEFRVHLITSRQGTGVTARIWHADGFRVGHAGGGGYDRRGAALGQAIDLFFGPELLTLPPKRIQNGGLSTFQDSGLYGLSFYDGRAVLDGSCGLECMLAVLKALGFSKVRAFETGDRSTMILAEKEPAMGLVQALSRCTLDGEEIDGQEFIMESDDAIETLSDVVRQARAIVAKES